jgi:hypothetical protein
MSRAGAARDLGRLTHFGRRLCVCRAGFIRHGEAEPLSEGVSFDNVFFSTGGDVRSLPYAEIVRGGGEP